EPEQHEERRVSDHGRSVASTPARRRLRALRGSAALVLLACTAVSRIPPSGPPSGHPPLPPKSSAASSTPSSAVPSGPPTPLLQLVGAHWTAAIDHVVAGRDVAVAVGVDDRIVYVHRGRASRVLASNEKLLTSMATLDVFGPRHRFPTEAAADASVRGGLLRGA